MFNRRERIILLFESGDFAESCISREGMFRRIGMASPGRESRGEKKDDEESNAGQRTDRRAVQFLVGEADVGSRLAMQLLQPADGCNCLRSCDIAKASLRRDGKRAELTFISAIAIGRCKVASHGIKIIFLFFNYIQNCEGRDPDREMIEFARELEIKFSKYFRGVTSLRRA